MTFHKLLLCLLLPFDYCIAQTDLVTNLHALSNAKKIAFPTDTCSSQKKRILDQLRADTPAFMEWFSLDPAEIKKDFHLMDIDGDSDMDLVYNGKIRWDVDEDGFALFLNKKGVYKEAINEPRRIVSFRNKELILYQAPCCARLYNTFTQYLIKKDTIVLQNGLYFFYSQGIPEFAGEPGIPVILKQILPPKLYKQKEWTMPAETEILYVPTDSIAPCLYVRNGNQIALAKNAALLPVYGSYTDQKNVLWYYCLLQPDSVKFVEEPVKHPFLAWVRAKS